MQELSKDTNQPPKNISKPMTMAQLMSSAASKTLKFTRGDQVTGKLVAQTLTDLIIDFGGKSEGVLDKKDFLPKNLAQLKIGDSITAYVLIGENDSGQVILTLSRQTSHLSAGRGSSFQDQLKKWQKFIQAKSQNTKLTGRVMEINKGGVLIEVDGVRGFMPVSQINFATLSSLGEVGLERLVGQEIPVSVIEVDTGANRLIFSSRSETAASLKDLLSKFQVGLKVKGKIVAIASFGLFVDLSGIEGLVHIQEISWDKVEDLNKIYKVGQEIAAQVTGIDEGIGRVNLSIRRLEKDPFEEMSQNFQTDDVIKGQVIEVNPTGVAVELSDGVDGYIPAEKLDAGSSFEVGQETNFLVDSVDKVKRRVNLTPFITSTVGLIYK